MADKVLVNLATGMEEKPCHIGIVPGVPIRRSGSRGAVMLRMEDRCFLPERTREFQRRHIACPACEEFGELVGNPRTNQVAFRRLLIGQ